MNLQNFWKKVEKPVDDASNCWNWTAGTNGNGYGKFKLNGKSSKAHRVSYELANGPIPDGFLVLHSCDNRKCVNPSHLRLGTHIENAQDKMIRGRWKGRGSIISAEVVTEIRRLQLLGLSQVVIGQRVGLSQTSVSRVLKEG